MEPTVNTTPVQDPIAPQTPEVSAPVVQAMPQQPVMAAAPMTPPSPAAAPAPMPAKKNSFGPLIGAVIIIAILIAGALYFWSPLLMPQQPTGNTSYNQSADTTADPIDATTQVSAATASVDALNGGSMDADLNTLSQ